MKLWCTFLLIYTISIVNTEVKQLDFKCPPHILWGRRADVVCGGSYTYHCLYDAIDSNTTVDVYVERCIASPKKYLGVQFVFSGGLDARKCDASRYSPYAVWSYTTTDCPLLKSQCNEEGQIVVDDGSSSHDRSCRCNYKEGYTYVQKPKNPCRCLPAEEDCSCYLKRCKSNERLTQDYNCQENIDKSYTCDEMFVEITEINKSFSANNDTKSKGLSKDIPMKSVGDKQPHRQQIRLIVLFGVLSLILFFSVLVLWILFEEWTFVFIIRNFFLGQTGLIVYEERPILSSSSSRYIVISCPLRILRGDSVTLECLIQDNTNVETVYWYHDDKLLTTDASDKYVGSTILCPSLTIKDTQDSDSGLYCCRVSFKDGFTVIGSTHLVIPKEIFFANMPVVRNYQETKQLQEMHDAFENGKSLVFLQGMHGSGKTQAAHMYCKKVKTKYSIIEKISYRKGVPFSDATKIHLGPNVEYKIPDTKEKTNESIIDNIKECLNHKERERFPYLLFIDDVDVDVKTYYNDIVRLVDLRNSVPNLDIILATTDETFITQFQQTNCCLIRFQGMESNEYEHLFEGIKADESDISKLVEQVGRTPLVLVSIAFQVKTIKKDLKTYFSDYCSEKALMLRSIDNFTNRHTVIPGKSYDKGVLMSQLVPLNYVKQNDKTNFWVIMKYLPFLRFESVSTIVLEAIYYHCTKCKWQQKKFAIDSAISVLSEVSLCHTVPKQYARMQSDTTNNDAAESKHEVLKDRTLSFHQVTIMALEIKEDLDGRNRRDILIFLLKIFCYEIDIDARTDVTVTRNLLIVNHAKNVLHLLEGPYSKEELFYVAYLQCGIGTTLLFERNDIRGAHQYLMKARSICLQIVSDKSYFTEEQCTSPTRKKRKGHVKQATLEHIIKVSKKVLNYSFPQQFATEFLLGKRRNQIDIDILEHEAEKSNLSVFSDHYISKEDLEILQKKGLALKTNKVQNYLLTELTIRILLNNGRALNELKYIVSHEASNEFIKDACCKELKTAREFCRIAKESIMTLELFGILECERSGRMLHHWNLGKFTPDDIDEDLTYFTNLFKHPPNIVFDFGIVKQTKAKNFTHKASCQRIILRWLTKKCKITCDEKDTEYLKCKDSMNMLFGMLHEMEGKATKYTWLTLPSLYIQCGRCLLLGTESDIEKALDCFNKAIKIEESRDVYWTHFKLKGYKGKIKCLRKQNKFDDALEVTNKVIKILSGVNLDEIKDVFGALRNDIEKDLKSGQKPS